jgi:hypothetical protein
LFFATTNTPKHKPTTKSPQPKYAMPFKLAPERKKQGQTPKPKARKTLPKRMPLFPPSPSARICAMLEIEAKRICMWKKEKTNQKNQKRQTKQKNKANAKQIIAPFVQYNRVLVFQDKNAVTWRI